jgi:hypothetical protein
MSNSSYSRLEKMTRVIFDLRFLICDCRFHFARLCASAASRGPFWFVHTFPAPGTDGLTPEITPRDGVIPRGARNLVLGLAPCILSRTLTLRVGLLLF